MHGIAKSCNAYTGVLGPPSRIFCCIRHIEQLDNILTSITIARALTYINISHTDFPIGLRVEKVVQISGIPQAMAEGSYSAFVSVTDALLDTTQSLPTLFNLREQDCNRAVHGPNGQDCGVHGTCFDEVLHDDRFTCVCNAGFIGANCDVSIIKGLNLVFDQPVSGTFDLLDGEYYSGNIEIIGRSSAQYTFILMDAPTNVSLLTSREGRFEGVVAEGLSPTGERRLAPVKVIIQRNSVAIYEEVFPMYIWPSIQWYTPAMLYFDVGQKVSAEL